MKEMLGPDTDISVAIIIPTRNRPSNLTKLLDSICASTIKPVQVIIVASGQDVASYLGKYRKLLNLRYLYTKKSGQVFQKKLGIKMLDKRIEWCVFTDDDLFFSKTALQDAINASKKKSHFPIIGVGFSLTPTSRIVKKNRATRFFARLFGLDSQYKGKVLKSGHGTSYLESADDQFTEWLNGVSMWKLETVKKYTDFVPEISPASCEDLVFSYEVSKFGKLIYASRAKVYFQNSARTNPENFINFRTAALWRLFFVIRHHELSLYRFLISQITRFLFLLIKIKREKSFTVLDYWKWLIKFNRLALELANSESNKYIVNRIINFQNSFTKKLESN